MLHIYFAPVVDMHNKIATKVEIPYGAPAYATSQILIRNNRS